MDLNQAFAVAKTGVAIRDDATMASEWTVRWHEKEKLLYYHDPKGVKRHKIKFSDAQRASFQWRTFKDAPEAQDPPPP